MRINSYFNQKFPKSDKLFTNSGRSALQAVIEDFNLQETTMVLPAYLCSDIFVPLLIQNKINPIFVDIPKNSFNIRFADVKKSLKDKSIKSILIVHTYGKVNEDILRIKDLCNKKKIILIEDCAHCIPHSFNGQTIGGIGDASIFSFYKMFGMPLGGIYIRNSGKMKITSRPYKLTLNNFLGFLRKTIIGRGAISLAKSFGLKKRFNPSKIDKIDVIGPPSIFQKSRIKREFVDFNLRNKMGKKIYSKLERRFSKKLPKKEFLENNSFYLLPLLVKNRDKRFKELISKGIRCNKAWDNPPVLDRRLKSKLKMPVFRNTSEASSKVISIIINPQWTEKDIKRISTSFP